MSETVVERPLPHARSPLRVLSSIRFDEVVLLQGAPVIGVLFSIGALTTGSIFRSAVFIIGSLCLVAHVYALNDWAGIEVDLNDPNRATRTFSAKGVSRAEVGLLAAALLVVSLLLLGSLGWTTFVLALAIVCLSVLYSAPALHMKGQPVFGSIPLI